MSAGPPIDRMAFERMRRILQNLIAGRRAGRAAELTTRPVPEEIAFKLPKA